MKISRAFFCLTCLIWVSSPAFPATKLKYEDVTKTIDAHGEVSSEAAARSITYVQKDLAISDAENVTRIVDLEKNTMTMIVHPEKIYTKIKLPIHLEDYADEEQLAFMGKVKPFLEATRVKIEESAETEQIGAFKARRVRTEAELIDGSIRYEIDAWLSTEVPVDSEAYDALSKNRFAMSLTTRSWADRLIDFEGMAVRQKTVITTSSHRTINESELVSVEEDVEIPPEKRRPPEGYEEVPFELAKWTGIGYKPTRRLPPREP